MKPKNNEKILKGIIVFKCVNAFFQLIAGFYVLSLMGKDISLIFLQLIDGLSETFQTLLINSMVPFLEKINDKGVLTTGIVLFLSGICSIIEGIGLHLRRRWAEWLTVIATGIFIPFELFYLLTSPSVGMLVTLLINSFIVLFLARHKEMFKTKAQVKFQKHPENYT